jgi:hypothetical protein
VPELVVARRARAVGVDYNHRLLLALLEPIDSQAQQRQGSQYDRDQKISVVEEPETAVQQDEMSLQNCGVLRYGSVDWLLVGLAAHLVAVKQAGFHGEPV